MKRVIQYPLVTEKSSNNQSAFNQYSFLVDIKANKLDVKREIESLKKGVEVQSVRTITVRGKVKRLGRTMGKRSNFKKAIVRLKAGQTIELFDTAV